MGTGPPLHYFSLVTDDLPKVTQYMAKLGFEPGNLSSKPHDLNLYLKFRPEQQDREPQALGPSLVPIPSPASM